MTAFSLSRDRLDDILSGISNAKVALIGDLCLDAYWTSDMRLSELSRETPHYPLPVVSETYSPGGAGNVAANLAALSPARLTVLGLTGDDWRSDILTRCLSECGIDTSAVLRVKGLVTNTYIKPIRTGISPVRYEDPRLDFEQRSPVPDSAARELISRLRDADFDVLLVSDQMKFGAVTPLVRSAIEEIASSGRTVVVDSRDRIGLYKNVIVKPNEVEASRVTGMPLPEGKDLLPFAESASSLLSRATGRPSVVTLGALGCVTRDGDAFFHIPGIPVRGETDTVGAGDTFLSAFGCSLAAGASLPEAASVACLASSVTVRKLGTTGKATAQEIRESRT